MTKQPTDSICQSGYEPDEMPVTDAMIAAGAAVAARYVDSEWEYMSDALRRLILTRIYSAMSSASEAQ